MTDTDKLKRLADEIAAYPDWMKDDILALIAENERLKEDAERWMDLGDKGWQERNEAVALVRKWFRADFDLLKADCQRETRAFLARIDGNHQPASDANPS